MEQRSKQESKCYLCREDVSLSDAVLLYDRFVLGDLNPVVHRKCKKGHHGDNV